MQTNLLIGLGAGLVSAMLFASASTGTVLGLFVLFFLSPLPVAIAGLGWGWRAAAVAAIAGAVAIGIISAPRNAIFHILALGAPTALMAYLTLLHREVHDETGAVATQWYPIGRMVTAAALIGAGLATIALLSVDMDAFRDLLRAHIERTLTELKPLRADIPAPTPEQIVDLTKLLSGLVPASIATTWFAIALLNMWLAGRVVRKSDRLVRPWPDLSELHLPRSLPIALAIALAGTFLGGLAGLVASGFASALITAYMLVGLAILHNATRGHAQRAMILTATYAVLFVFGMVAAPLLALIGIAEPFSPLRRKPPPRGPSPT